ncbi:hypothetical protein L1987_12857 [Smallanthus sonchifolius]|uniref:Uncharacterized protein n=1 Tax=Smallanthus sonchifolius TaxID=185202 RepID=A0ACB9JHL5_9ASTR|nr:hypothetical protein L1987_12857 [Smallanthus sonchifolius]
MLKADYFFTCRFHGDANKSECNMYCLDCCGNSLCSYCLSHHKDHSVVQAILPYSQALKEACSTYSTAQCIGVKCMFPILDIGYLDTKDYPGA